MKSRTYWLTLIAALAVLAIVAVAAPVHAHPLGNFTVNQYAGLRIATSTVDIDYVLDLAELPTIAERADIETAGAATQCARIAAASTLRVDHKPVTLTSAPATLTFPPGTAGLATLRLECHLTAQLRLHGPTEIGFAFGAYTDRLGLREITATGDGVTISRTDTATTSHTARLTSYTTDLLAKPLDMRKAAITVQPGGAAAGTAPPATSKPGQDSKLLATLAGVTGKTELTLGLALLAIALAALLGAGHAVAPGHGKTIMAAYLIGHKGHRRQALAIAATVTATHTAGVLLLGLAIAASFTLAPQALYRWLAFANGLLVAAIGLHLLRRALRRSHHPHHHHDGHHHPHSWEHGHHHEHDHGHGLMAGHLRSQTHSETAPQPETAGGHATRQLAVADRSIDVGQPHDHHYHPHHHESAPSRKTVLAMGLVGGLTPSPSAVVVLLGAAAVGRAWFGVLLVLAYGVGMAGTLTGVGMALARFSDQIQALIARRGGSALLRHLPAGTGALILIVGIGIAVVALLGPAGFVQ